MLQRAACPASLGIIWSVTEPSQGAGSGATPAEARRRRIGFDLDGVLIRNPFARGVDPHVRRLMATGPKLAGLSPEDARKRIDGAVVAEVVARSAAGRSRDAFDWDDIYGLVSASFGGPKLPDIAGLVRHYSAVPGMIALLPGARAALDELVAAGHELVVVTNGFERYQLPVLEVLGIDTCFAGFFSPDRTGYAKPEAGMFEAAGPLDVFVGDTLLHDVYGANAAGVPAVWVSPTLPEALVALAPWERPRDDGFRSWLEHALESSLYRPLYPEATAEACMPAAVVRAMSEVGETVRWMLGEGAGRG